MGHQDILLEGFPIEIIDGYRAFAEGGLGYDFARHGGCRAPRIQRMLVMVELPEVRKI